MTFWQSEVIDFAIDRETRKHMEEQRKPDARAFLDDNDSNRYFEAWAIW